MITEKEAARKAAKCNAIVNTKTGNVIRKSAFDKIEQWEMLFHDCIMRGDSFEFVYDSVVTEDTIEEKLKDEENKEWKKHELKELSMPALRRIGNAKGVKHTNPDKLIDLIIERQSILKGE